MMKQLAAGGTLLKHKSNGDAVHWLILTSIKEENGFAASVVETRRQEAKEMSALAAFRGATAGCEYAESFMILKERV